MRPSTDSRGSNVTRRDILRTAGGAGAAMAAAACAPAAAPAAPSAAPATGAAPAAEAWQAEWDRLVKAAKSEGRVSVLVNFTGPAYDPLVRRFEATFPGVHLDFAAQPSVAVYEPKIKAERAANVYSYDAAVLPPGSAIRALLPIGALDPVRPLLFHPQALDEKLWTKGIDWGYMDTERKYAYCYEHNVLHSVSVNTDAVKDGEIKSFLDVVDPRWKGKIVSADVRFGGTFLAMTAARMKHGEDVLKRFVIDQEPVFIRETRQVTEDIVRGKHPIAVYAPKEDLMVFQEQGLGKNIKYLDLPDVDTMTNNSVLSFNRAPNPNAGKLFINWFLTKEPQELFAKASGRNSRRTDISPADTGTFPTAGRDYAEMGRESASPEIVKTQELLGKLVQQRG